MAAATNFECEPFAEGRFRIAFKGTRNKPPSKAGTKCVVKKLKDSFTWEPTGWQETLDIVKECKKLASGFNSYSSSNKPVKFTDVEVQKVVNVGDSTRVQLDEYITVEDYISGNYEKFCNNYGTVATTSTSMPAFVHWSWAHTKGEIMIADLQGVRKDDCYHLTDPCLLSNTHGGKYGCTDMGVEGIAMFFLNHTCTDFCRSIPKPGLQGVSRQQLAAALRTQQQISTSTAYSHEVSFPKSIRDALIVAFKRVAETAQV